MKKTLSMLIAVFMLIGMFSGAVLFTGSAAETATQAFSYTYVQLNGVQNWTAEDVANLNEYGASFAISDKGLIGNAKQSIELTVKSIDQSNQRFCLTTCLKSNQGFLSKNPFTFADTTQGYKLSAFDGIAIAFSDADGKEIPIDIFRARLMRDASDWSNFSTYQASYNDIKAIYANGYYHLSFADYSALPGTEINNISIMSILFYKTLSIGEKAYISDICAYTKTAGPQIVDKSELEAELESLRGTQFAEDNPEAMAAAEAVLADENATQIMVDEQVDNLERILHTSLPSVNFDENNIVLTFGAISDIHIDGTLGSGSTNKYLNAAQKLLKYSGGKIDAVTVAGDFSSSSYNDNIPQAFKSINEQVFDDDLKVFFVTGNHDAQGSDWSSLNKFYEQLSCYTSEDEAGSQHNRGNRHMVINGYHFLAINMMDYWNSQEARFEQQDLEWLDRELAAARAAAPGKQIFVYMHAQVYGTTYGSDLYTGTYWGSKSVYDHLKDYPEVVTFAGHIHFPLEDERTIYQRDFTSLDTGSVQYMAIDNGYLESGSKTTIDDSWGVSSGLMVQIDANGNMKVTRIDFGRDAIIKQPFYVPAPDMDNETHLMYYDDYRFRGANEAPVFPKDATLTAAINGNNLEANFTAANDDDMVHRYLFEIVGIPSGSKMTVKSFSEFYNYPQVRDMPKSYRRVIPYSLSSGDKGFEVSVYAVDSGGKASEPLVFNSIIGAPTITPPPGPNLINVYFITGEPQVSGLTGISLTTRGETKKFKTKYGFDCAAESRVTAFVPSTLASLTAKKFTAEVAFTVGSVGTEQYILSCNKDEKGYSLYLTAEGKIAFKLFTSKGNYSLLSESVVKSGEYRSVIVNFQSNTLTIYIDGTKEDEVTTTGNVTYNSNVGYTLGARLISGGNYGDCFDGVIYQAGVGSYPYTDETAGQRAMDYTNGWNYKYIQSLYNECESVKEAIALNPDINDSAKKILNNYLLELDTALNAVAVTEAYINTVSRSEEIVANLADFNVALELPEIAAPVVTGVADGEVYTEPVTITWDEATNAELDHEPFENGSVVSKPGEHKLFVQNKYASVAIYFTIEGDEEPVVSIEDGAEFGIPGEPVSATWTPEEATATLNGEPYVAGTVIGEIGEYVLVVTNGTKSVTVNFTIVDNYMVPEVSVADGTEFKLSDFGEGPLVITWTPEEATATLNGEEYTHTHIEEPGEYVLVVTNGTKSVTINFTIVDDTPVPTLSIEDGAQFDLYTAVDPIAVTWTPEGATGTLNGEEYLAGTAITEVGEYTLTVVNGSKEVTVHFTVVDTTPQVKRGDMDGDGEITVADALKALRIAAKLAQPTEEDLAIGDVDNDGEITVADALRILRVAAKLASEDEL
ncbi:MAG: metallophosphoesterase [Clostridia bacterium]|nr:metallophosphoesterase [Clostridia bacterium]